NATPSSSSYVVSYSYVGKNGQEKPTKLADGEWYQTARISTGARADFALGRYPLDQQTLDIRFENNTYDDKQLVYVPDVGHMARHPQLDVAGWGVKGSSIGAVLHRYGTDFGVVGGGAAASDYSQVVFSTHIERPVSHFLIKLFIPLLVALLATIGSLFMREDESDVRPAVAAMGLLAIVFLQQSYAGDLPATAPGVLLDQIYLAAYVVVSLTFLRTIYLVNAIHHEGNERHSYLKTTDRFVLGMVGFFLLAVLLLLFL
ncbi:MAG: hypothetical protein JWM71_1764, partial [Solirubrobacteraceae bacterium]|nr:hypothetical protein [Solirubrobacteraceae bacterium]